MRDAPSSIGNPVHPARDGTSIVATAWVAVTVYSTLRELAAGRLTGALVAGMIATFTVAWALMERKRWGRLALMGIAAGTMAEAVWRAASIAHAAMAPHSGREYAALLLRGQDGSMAIGATVAILSVVTLLWLRTAPVRGQFEMRKRRSTRWLQVLIASLLIALWAVGQLTVAAPASAARTRPGNTGIAGHRAPKPAPATALVQPMPTT